MLDNTRQRHSDIISLPELEIPIAIIGAGSIGSFFTLSLAKLGATDITGYDFDKIEPENIGCQLYGEGDIGKPKIEALKARVLDLTGVEIKAENKEWTENEGAEIIIVAVDSLEIRRKIWQKLENDIDCTHIIDGRMGGEFMRIYTIDLNNDEAVKKYLKTLEVKEGEPVSCSARSIVYNNYVLAGLMLSQLKKIIKEQEYPTEIIFNLADLMFMKGGKNGKQ